LIRIIAKLIVGALGLFLIGLLMQESLELHMQGAVAFEHRIEQMGLCILSGIILGIVTPAAVRRWFFLTLSITGTLLALTHVLVLQTDARALPLLENWAGLSLGLLVMAGLFRSWTAMYDKHLVAWGGTSDDDHGQT
jgi:hypothetical protein